MPKLIRNCSMDNWDSLLLETSWRLHTTMLHSFSIQGTRKLGDLFVLQLCHWLKVALKSINPRAFMAHLVQNMHILKSVVKPRLEVEVVFSRKSRGWYAQKVEVCQHLLRHVGEHVAIQILVIIIFFGGGM